MARGTRILCARRSTVEVNDTSSTPMGLLDGCEKVVPSLDWLSRLAVGFDWSRSERHSRGHTLIKLQTCIVEEYSLLCCEEMIIACNA